MIRRAVLTDLQLVTSLLTEMYLEVKGKEELYLEKMVVLARHHMNNDEVWLHQSNALYIMKDESSCVLKTKLWNGVSVYIQPRFRKGKILARLYKHMFDNYKGTIMGFTEANSVHNKVLLKRHTLLGYVYEMRRPK